MKLILQIALGIIMVYVFGAALIFILAVAATL